MLIGYEYRTFETGIFCAGTWNVDRKMLADTADVNVCFQQALSDADCGDFFYHIPSQSWCRCMMTDGCIRSGGYADSTLYEIIRMLTLFVWQSQI